MNDVLDTLSNMYRTLQLPILITEKSSHELLRSNDVPVYVSATVLCKNEGKVIDYIKNNIDKDAVVVELSSFVVKVITRNIIFDINYSTTSSKSFTQADCKFKLFTADAVYILVNEEIKSDTLPVIDPIGGLIDIKKRKLVFVANPNKVFKEYPYAMLDTILRICKYNFSVDPVFFNAARKEASNILRIPKHKLRYVMQTIMLSDKPSKGIKLMGKAGILDYLIPELASTYKLKQNSEHHTYDVFTHSVLTCDAIKPELYLRLAALLHDIGKPSTNDPEKETFYKHEMAGANITGNILNRLGFDKRISSEIVKLVRNHMYCYSKEWTDKAVNRFIKKTGITEKDLENLENYPLFLLRQADRMGNGMKSSMPITKKQKDFEERIRQVFLNHNGEEDV
jgi:putative nucleotidyltransferase with HDIG domain